MSQSVFGVGLTLVWHGIVESRLRTWKALGFLDKKATGMPESAMAPKMAGQRGLQGQQMARERAAWSEQPAKSSSPTITRAMGQEQKQEQGQG